MKESFWTKLLFSFFAVGGIAFLGVIGFIFTAISGGLMFYTPLVVVLSVVIAIYVVLLIFNILSRKISRIVLLSIVGLSLLATAGYEIKAAYVSRLATVDDREVNLTLYEPFVENSKVVNLDEPADFHIDSNAPRLDGATALYPLYSAFVQSVYPVGKYDPYDYRNSQVLCTSTPEAYKRLIEGETDIIFVAAPSLAQQKHAKRKGVELKLTPIGREAFVFFVNKRNSVTGLAADQLKDIYAGKITNWKTVGGPSNRIRAFQRPEDSGSQTMLQKFMGDTPLMTPPQEDIADVMSGIIQQTSSYRNYKNALGYSFLFYASEMNQSGEITLLSIDGVKPDKKSIRSGQYPLATEFYAVTTRNDNPNIQPFLDWLQSSQGQELVEKTGYTSLK
ncbi:substrate-binding domain-containing protein [Paenibacillus sp. FSL R10-2734]|uniref:PstS family phosphate ABC transporter substrate-binding protein n=1 Tax=Paenibacillus sp. FSL R10-2734 TaxID=2954691 RepID=UPI0030DB3E76